jgi:hypothetical protein
MRPHPTLAGMAEGAVANLRASGRTLVVCHLRGTDYGSGEYQEHPIFYRAPTRWYVEMLDRVWDRLDDPVLYLASDEPEAFIPDLHRFRPVTAGDFHPDSGKTGLFLDHYVMTQADLLAVSNSSFSVTAAMVNERGRMFLRPDRSAAGLIPFDPWNTQIVLFPPESLPATVPSAVTNEGASETVDSAALQELRERAAVLEAEISALRNSTSWKATAWLRAVAHLLGR